MHNISVALRNNILILYNPFILSIQGKSWQTNNLVLIYQSFAVLRYLVYRQKGVYFQNKCALK